MCTVGDVFNQHYSTLDSWFIRNLARCKTQFSDSLNSLHILFYWSSIQFGIQVPYFRVLHQWSAASCIWRRYNRGGEPAIRGPDAARVSIVYGPHQNCRCPSQNTTSRQNKTHDKQTASRRKSLSLLNIVLSPYYPL